MDVLRTWIVTLVSVTILCTIIEKFAPQGNLNRYVKLVCGLSVTVIIAIPAINFLKGEFNFEKIAWNEYIRLSEGELIRRIRTIEEKDTEDMLRLYKESLISDIKDRFKGEGKFLVSNVDVVLYENRNHENYGMIRALYLTLEPGAENRNRILGNETIEYIKNELKVAFGVDKNSVVIDQSRFNGGG